MKLTDCHTHTQFSVDSEADIEKCIERAMELGLAAYAVTDHCECNRWYSQEHYPDETTYPYFNFGRDFENSLSAVTALKEKYRGRLNLICGVEMGQATHDFGIAEKIVSDPRLDFVLASMHQLPKTEDFCFIDYSQYSMDGIYDQGIIPTQRSNPGLLHCRQVLYHLSHQGSPSVHGSRLP